MAQEYVIRCNYVARNSSNIYTEMKERLMPNLEMLNIKNARETPEKVLS